MSRAEQIARLQVSLDEIEPAIWRRLEVPLTTSLKGLHDAIQAVMGWEDYHLFEFRVGETVYGIPDPDGDWGRKIHSAKSTKLDALIAKGLDRFLYVYDLGDNWQHLVTVEAVEPGAPEILYPRFIDGARRCPPEDIGSTDGYYAFLDAMSHPRHPEHHRMLDWYGGPYDPDDIDRPQIERRLHKLASRRAAGKAAYEKSKPRS